MQTTLDYLNSHFMPFLLNYWLATQHPVIRLPVFFMGICAGILCIRSKQGDFDAFQSKVNLFLNSYFHDVVDNFHSVRFDSYSSHIFIKIWCTALQAKIAAYKDLSNNLKWITVIEKSHQVALLLKNLEKT